MLRRLHPEQPESFAFSPDNAKWAEGQISKYPEGRQASAIIPLLWRAQEQEGWLTRPAIEHVADMLGMAYIRALEVASFYFMFQLQPVGSVAHFQICGTTSCMICGAEDLVAVCRDKIAPRAHQLSEDGKFSWEEVECLGACANAPMAQIGKDYYEDLTAERLAEIIDEMSEGKVPTPGPQQGRYASEPAKGLTSLKDFDSGHTRYNASAQLATDIGDTIKRIDGTEVPLLTPWLDRTDRAVPPGPKQPGKDGTGVDHAPRSAPPADTEAAKRMKAEEPHPSEGETADKTGVTVQEAEAASTAKPRGPTDPKGESADAEASATGGNADAAPEVGDDDKPQTLDAARAGGPDDLKRIKGVGPKLEALLHRLGFYHFDQVASWTDREVAWVDQHLEGFKGRVRRDDWVSQARALASGESSDQ